MLGTGATHSGRNSTRRRGLAPTIEAIRSLALQTIRNLARRDT
jgi:hypothetical protein